MSVFLKNIKSLLDDSTIDREQALYLIFLKSEIEYPIDDKKLLSLVIRKYVLNNKVSKKLINNRKIKNLDQAELQPYFTNELSKDVYKYICTRVCLKDPKTEYLLLPEGEENLDFTASEYLENELAIAPFYWTVLFLFPTAGEKNKRWESVFLGDFYDGVPLRIRSKESAKLFLKEARKNDMGAILLGMYRYIKASIRDKKAYITTIPKAFKSYDEYYRQALIDIKKAKTVKELFKEKGNSNVKNIIL
jgi:hypothetical protein